MKEKYTPTDAARILVRWLTPLFYLSIAQLLLGYLTKDTVLSVLPWLEYPAFALSALCGAASAVCLWMCAAVHDRYQKAAVFTGLGVLMDAVVRFSANRYVDLMVGYPALVVATFGVFLTYTAHAAILNDRDSRLAARFRELWRYTLVTVVAMFLSPFLARASGIMALLLLLAATVGNIVVTIVAIVSLRQMLRILERDSMTR